MKKLQLVMAAILLSLGFAQTVNAAPFIAKAELKIEFTRMDTWTLVKSIPMNPNAPKVQPPKGNMETEFESSYVEVSKFEYNVENNSGKMLNLINLKDFAVDVTNYRKSFSLNGFNKTTGKKEGHAFYGKSLLTSARVRMDKSGIINSATISSRNFTKIAEGEFTDFLWNLVSDWDNKLLDETDVDGDIEELKVKASAYKCKAYADSLVCTTKIKAEMLYTPDN